jgi:cobalt/nickel transport protein
MNKREIFLGLIIAIFLAMIVSPFASKLPDGLEKVAEDKGFLDKEAAPFFPSPIPDYAWPYFKSEKLATSFAGVFGTLIVFTLTYALAKIVKR